MGSIKRRPDGKWRARYRDPEGREHARHFPRKIDADQWLTGIQADLLQGRYIDPKAGRTTFGEYADQWRAGQPHRPATASLYERLLRLHVYPSFGHRALSSVRRSEIQGWVAGLTVAPATARQAYALTRTIFRAAVEDRLIVESPCRRIALPELSEEKVVPLTVKQVQSIVAASSEDLQALIVLGAATGLRSGELLGLTVDRVDFLRRTVAVEQQLVYIVGQPPFLGPPKTRASRRTVPAPEFALHALAAHLAAFPPGDRGLVFQRPGGGPILRTTLNGRWRRTLKRAGLPAATHFHHLRHHYASVLIDGGESVKVVQERLGHANAVETLKTYAHLWPSSDERTRTIVGRAWSAPADSGRTRGHGQAADQGV